MKAMFLRIGNSSVATDGFIKAMGFEVVKSVPPNNQIISKGVLYSSEFACFPFKVTLGILLYGLEQGVEIYVLPTGKSQKSCQLADFGIAKKYISKKIGKSITIIELENIQPQKIYAKFKPYNDSLTIQQVINSILIGRKKLHLIEELTDFYRRIYISSGKTKAQSFFNNWISVIDKENSLIKLLLIEKNMNKQFEKYPKSDISKLPKIGVIGDIYCLNELAINNNIYDRLLSMNVWVNQGTRVSDLIENFLKISPDEILIKSEAEKYLKYNVASFSKDTIIDAIKYAKEGYDGLIHIYPFNCMPEVTVRNILPKVSRDFNIPILYLPIDEQTGDAGFTTRVEAFVDLIKIRRKLNKGKT